MTELYVGSCVLQVCEVEMLCAALCRSEWTCRDMWSAIEKWCWGQHSDKDRPCVSTASSCILRTLSCNSAAAAVWCGDIIAWCRWKNCSSQGEFCA